MPPVLRAKWDDEVLNEGFVPFPKRLLRAIPHLFPENHDVAELAALLAVVDYRRPNLRNLPSTRYLAFVAGLGPKQFKRILTNLEAKNWIETEGSDEEIDVTLSGFFEAIKEAAPE